jgi:hypothetical protein
MHVKGNSCAPLPTVVYKWAGGKNYIFALGGCFNRPPHAARRIPNEVVYVSGVGLYVCKFIVCRWFRFRARGSVGSDKLCLGSPVTILNCKLCADITVSYL